MVGAIGLRALLQLVEECRDRGMPALAAPERHEDLAADLRRQLADAELPGAAPDPEAGQDRHRAALLDQRLHHLEPGALAVDDGIEPSRLAGPDDDVGIGVEGGVHRPALVAQVGDRNPGARRQRMRGRQHGVEQVVEDRDALDVRLRRVRRHRQVVDQGDVRLPRAQRGQRIHRLHFLEHEAELRVAALQRLHGLRDQGGSDG
jgi:hypothetical protein